MIIFKIIINLLLIVFNGINFYLASWNLIQFHLKQKKIPTNQKLVTNSKLYYVARTFPYYSLIIVSVWLFTNCFNEFFVLFNLI